MTTPNELRAIAERLRMWPATDGAGDGLSSSYVGNLMTQAADAITSLLADLEAAETALEQIASEDWYYTTEPPHAPDGSNRKAQGKFAKIARTALANPTEEVQP